MEWMIVQFTHRRNQDSTFDSICRSCYMTVGKRKLEAELEIDERVHVCESRHPYNHSLNRYVN